MIRAGLVVFLIHIINLLHLSQVWAYFSNLNLPRELGIVKEVVISSNTAEEKNLLAVIHIQDAHCNYESQKNMAKLLRLLFKSYNVKLILVEGGWGNISLSFMQNFGNFNLRHQVAEDFLRKGKISGEEYFALVSDYDPTILGIEDEQLYEKNRLVFLNMENFIDKAQGEIAFLNEIADRIQEVVYSQELKEVENKLKQWKHKEITLTEYISWLMRFAKEKEISISEFNNLNYFLEATELEKNLEATKVEEQRKLVMQELALLLDKKDKEVLLEKISCLQKGEINSEEFYTFILEVTEDKEFLVPRYPDFFRYVRYILLESKIKIEQLTSEIRNLNEQLQQKLSVNETQKRLLKIKCYLELANKLLELELSPEEYHYFTCHQEYFSSSYWQKELISLTERYNLNLSIRPCEVVDSVIKQAAEFYQLGIEREEAFMTNIKKYLKEYKQNIAVVITGGFHTPGLTRRFKKENISYAVISPNVSQKTEREKYELLLDGQYNGLEDEYEEE
ncbi:MAG: hypothetical protein N2606_03765 [Candidatus Omnitrophica bacterium]|nr:hypothetical protein [Candidatus Omnitrophota bacterium]